MENKPQKAALSVFFNPANLIGNQYNVKIYCVGEEPKDRAALLDNLSAHLNHSVNALAAMLNTAVRDFGVDKTSLYNELINYLTAVRNSNMFIEFEPPSINARKLIIAEPVELQILYDPTEPREKQYSMVHETYLEKPKTKEEVLRILLTDICHLTNGLVYLLNKVIRDCSQSRSDVYNQTIHQLLLIRGFGLELTKEMPIFDATKK